MMKSLQRNDVAIWRGNFARTVADGAIPTGA